MTFPMLLLLITKTVSFPGFMVAETVKLSQLTHPFISVTQHVYTPRPKEFIVLVVEPLLHWKMYGAEPPTAVTEAVPSNAFGELAGVPVIMACKLLHGLPDITKVAITESMKVV
jgi:NaMN:DMB phosphoribosyltransferase